MNYRPNVTFYNSNAMDKRDANPQYMPYGYKDYERMPRNPPFKHFQVHMRQQQHMQRHQHATYHAQKFAENAAVQQATTDITGIFKRPLPPPPLPAPPQIQLPFPFNVGQTYVKATYESKMWTKVGQKVCGLTKGLLLSHESLAEMDGLELASFLLAAHVKQHELDPDESCVLLTEEVRTILHVKEQHKMLSKFHNAIPRMAAPLASELPPPPAQWIDKAQKNVKRV